MGRAFHQTYVSPTRLLRALYMPQPRRGLYRTLSSLVSEIPVRQGASTSWPAGGVTGPFRAQIQSLPSGIRMTMWMI